MAPDGAGALARAPAGTGSTTRQDHAGAAKAGASTRRRTAVANLDNYLAGGRLFPTPTGNFCSRNLTPAPGTSRAAGLTRDEFIYVIRTGCDPQDDNFNDPKSCSLLQVMPWPNFSATLSRKEITAIYDYLSVLPHKDPGTQCIPAPQGLAAQ